MLTRNEKAVLRLLISAFGTDYSINQIARECKLAPNGALKILRKLEREGILEAKSIANIKSYKINFDNEKTSAVLELALGSELEGRMKHRMDDFKELKPLTRLLGQFLSALIAMFIGGFFVNLTPYPFINTFIYMNKQTDD